MKTPDTTILLDMLRYRRPHGSESERQFIERFLMPLNPHVDPAGNLIIRIGYAPVLWSSHTDSVHTTPGMQQITIDQGIISLAQGSKSSCLGADDAAGVWIMHQMILNGTPGLYIFHRGEEVGGIGSSYIAKETPELLKDIQFAIALDRKGTGDIITHQFGRCCSDIFADSLSDQLDGYVASDGGVFTDTANYVDIIGECTNLSVGYEYAHSSNEILDMWFASDLCSELMRLDVSRLVSSREPGELEDDYELTMYQAYGSYGIEPYKHSFPSDTTDLASLVRKYPDYAADLLESLGYDAAAFFAEIEMAGGC